MSSPYFIAPDGQDNPTLWMETDSSSQPLAVASLYQDHLVSDDLEVAAILWHAGTAALAPSDEQIEAIAARVHEAWMAEKREQGIETRTSETGEELMVPYEQLSEMAKLLDRATVQAVLLALQAHAEGAAT